MDFHFKKVSILVSMAPTEVSCSVLYHTQYDVYGFRLFFKLSILLFLIDFKINRISNKYVPQWRSQNAENVRTSKVD